MCGGDRSTIRTGDGTNLEAGTGPKWQVGWSEPADQFKVDEAGGQALRDGIGRI